MDAECAVALVIPESLVEDNGCDPAGRGRDNLWEAVARVAEVRAVVRAVAEMVVAVRGAAGRGVGVRGGGGEGGGTSSQILGRTEPWHLKMRLGNE